MCTFKVSIEYHTTGIHTSGYRELNLVLLYDIYKIDKIPYPKYWSFEYQLLFSKFILNSIGGYQKIKNSKTLD